MRQKGFVLLPLLVVCVVILTLGVVYIQKPGIISQNKYLQNLISPTDNNLSPTPTPTIKASIVPSAPKTNTPKPTRTPAPTAATAPKSTCTINAMPDSGNALGIKFIYSVQSSRGTYMIGAQWDFDGNGSWDTDMSQSNGTITKIYPSNGTYTAKLQLKMSDGKITNVCSKSVTVPSGFTVKLTGRVYEDINCNDMQEPNEKGISGVTINIFNIPAWTIYTTITSDSNGYYDLTRILNPGDSLTIQPAPIAAYGYKINADNHTTTLNSAYPSGNIDLPQVPAANIGQCH